MRLQEGRKEGDALPPPRRPCAGHYGISPRGGMPGRTRTEGGLRSCGLNPGAPTPACETHRGGRKGWRECRQIRAGARTALGLRAGGETPARAWAPHTGLWLRTRALDVPHAVREPRCGCVRREARRAGARRPRCMVRTERRLLANAAAGKGGGASGRPPGSPCHRCGSVGDRGLSVCLPEFDGKPKKVQVGLKYRPPGCSHVAPVPVNAGSPCWISVI